MTTEPTTTPGTAATDPIGAVSQLSLDIAARKIEDGAQVLEGAARYRIDENDSPTNRTLEALHGRSAVDVAARQLAAARDGRALAAGIRDGSWPMETDQDFLEAEVVAFGLMHGGVHGGSVPVFNGPHADERTRALESLVEKGVMTHGTPTANGAPIYTMASYGGADAAGQRLPADYANMPRVGYVPVEYTRPPNGAPGEPQPQTAYMDLDLEQNSLSIGYTKPGEAVPPSGDPAVVRYNIPALTDQAADQLMEQMLPVAQQVMEGASYVAYGDTDPSPSASHLTLTGDRGGQPAPGDTVVVLDPPAVAAMFAIDDRCQPHQFTAEQRTDLTDASADSAQAEQEQAVPVGDTWTETMKAQLTSEQRTLHDEVTAKSSVGIWDDIKAADAATTDKIVVAEVLGDSGKDMADELGATAEDRQAAAQQFTDNAAAVQRAAEAEPDAARQEHLRDHADGLAYRGEKLAPPAASAVAADESSTATASTSDQQEPAQAAAEPAMAEPTMAEPAAAAAADAAQEAAPRRVWVDDRVTERTDGWTVRTTQGAVHVIAGPLGVAVYAGPNMELVQVDEEGTLAIGMGDDPAAVVDALLAADNDQIRAEQTAAEQDSLSAPETLGLMVGAVAAQYVEHAEVQTTTDAAAGDLAVDATTVQPTTDATAGDLAVDATAVQPTADATAAVQQADDGDTYE